MVDPERRIKNTVLCGPGYITAASRRVRHQAASRTATSNRLPNWRPTRMNWPDDGSHEENHHHVSRLLCLAFTAFALAGCASGNVKSAPDHNAGPAPSVLNRWGIIVKPNDPATDWTSGSPSNAGPMN